MGLRVLGCRVVIGVKGFGLVRVYLGLRVLGFRVEIGVKGFGLEGLHHHKRCCAFCSFV